MKILALDTETSSLPLWTQQSDHPGQPHMLQLAAIHLDIDADGATRQKVFQSWIKPEGWAVDERLVGDDGRPTAFSINKISNEFLHDKGRPLAEVMDEFDAEFMAPSEEVYAFGAGFDRRILRIAAFRRWGRDGHPRKGAAHPGWFCVLKTMTPLCKLPATQPMIDAGRGHQPKPPKLSEAYRWAFGKDFDGAHDAMNDIRATLELWEFVRAKGVPFHRLADKE